MVKEIAKKITLQDREITIDSRLNCINEKVMSPKKLQMANELLARVGVPDLEKILKEDEAKKAKQKRESNPIGSLIKQTRLKRHLSKEDLAALMGVDNTLIYRLENNDTTISMEIILKVFHVLDAELSFVVKLDE